MIRKIYVVIFLLLIVISCQTESDVSKDVEKIVENCAEWYWNEIPVCEIGTEDAVINERIVLEPVFNNISAEFAALSGRTKFRYEEGLGVALYMQNKAATTLDNIKDVYQASFEIFVKEPSECILVMSGNGDATPARAMAVFDKSGRMLVSKDCLSNQKKEEINIAMDAIGSYVIKTSGTRIYSVKISSL